MKVEDALIHITVWAANYQDTSPDRKNAEKEFAEVFGVLITFLPIEAIKGFYEMTEKLISDLTSHMAEL